MTVAVDSGLDFMRRVLELRGYRQQILSADIANASTPGFKALDLDFRQALGAADIAAGPVSMTQPSTAQPSAPRLWLVDDPRHLSSGGGAPGAAAAVKYQSDAPVTLDGNSVDLNREKTAAAENAVQYEAAATFTAQMLKMLSLAVGGSGAVASGG